MGGLSYKHTNLRGLFALHFAQRTVVGPVGIEPTTYGLTSHFDFRRRLTGVRGLDCPFTLAFAVGATRPVSTPSTACCGLARDCHLISQEGFPDFEWFHP